MIGLQEMRSLQSEEGLKALAAMAALPQELEIHKAISLMRKQFTPDLAGAAIEMTALRRRARAKFVRADEMLFTAEALEQSSGEVLARYHARRFADSGTVGDLCCGIGGDLIGLAGRGPAYGLDRDIVRLIGCRHNLEVYGEDADAFVALADVMEPPLYVRSVFADPSRRSAGRRTRLADEYSPPLPFFENMAKHLDSLWVKASPATEFPILPGCERELVSLDRVCREMALVWGDIAQPGRTATVLRRAAPGSWDISIHKLHADGVEDVSAPVLDHLPAQGTFLIEPDPAIVRARLIGVLAEEIGGVLVSQEIAYLSCDSQVVTPFGKAHRVEDSFPYNERELRIWLAARGVGHLIVKKRGFPLSPEDVCARMKLKGLESATIILTRRGDRHIVIVLSSDGS